MNLLQLSWTASFLSSCPKELSHSPTSSSSSLSLIGPGLCFCLLVLECVSPERELCRESPVFLCPNMLLRGLFLSLVFSQNTDIRVAARPSQKGFFEHCITLPQWPPHDAGQQVSPGFGSPLLVTVALLPLADAEFKFSTNSVRSLSLI